MAWAFARIHYHGLESTITNETPKRNGFEKYIVSMRVKVHFRTS